ncbi:hypothetical protein [Chitinophaga pinensis]|uniref:Uncharacterized protein n=1 Tax=Chitinophaga pinensis (strain ATCC 43595 / DSM 2588 / LMG 13176 / NBRC 15968 / NCIMB 11800 / UQM 2034) TaxID=485918 RepID=A0A979GY86_CHIPD|nr:hypothetical protein [Chitinophaga pinensis]ACU61745.1 hypothetical protein Cpin_4296 [Chitinophaga pinensis DSM 2588]
MDLQKILDYMNADKARVWYPLSELVTKTGEDPVNVLKDLNASDKVVRSSRLSKDGDQLFASKEDFSKSEPLLSKVIAAFRNRID